jgi:hypothetical protein
VLLQMLFGCSLFWWPTVLLRVFRYLPLTSQLTGFYSTQHVYVLWKVVRDRPDPALTSIPDGTLAHQAHSSV